MEKLAEFLFGDPFRLFGIIIVVCLLVIFIPKLHRLFHLINPPTAPDRRDKVTWRHVLAEPIEAERQTVFENSRKRLRSEIDADTDDALSYTALADAISNLSVAGEDVKLAHALEKVLNEQARRRGMTMADSAMYSSSKANRHLEARIKKILDSLEVKHHRRMKFTDVKIKRWAYLAKKKMEKD